jgi:hypothetical protein
MIYYLNFLVKKKDVPSVIVVADSIRDAYLKWISKLEALKAIGDTKRDNIINCFVNNYPIGINEWVDEDNDYSITKFEDIRNPKMTSKIFIGYKYHPDPENIDLKNLKYGVYLANSLEQVVNKCADRGIKLAGVWHINKYEDVIII